MNIQFINFNSSIHFNGRARKSAITKQELETLIEHGNNYSQIGKLCNLPIESVFKYAKRYGVQSYSAKRRAEFSEKIIDLLKSGKSLKEIAEQFQYSLIHIYGLIPGIIGREAYQEARAIGYNKKIVQKTEELKNCYENNKDVKEVYDSWVGHRSQLKKIGKEIKQQIRSEKTKKLIENSLKQISQNGNVLMASKELNIPYSTLVGLLDNNDVKIAKDTAKQNKLETIKKLVQKGYNIKQIADKMQCKKNNITLFLHKYYPNWREDLVNFRIKQITKLLNQGLTYKQIGEIMHISKYTVARTIRAYRKIK